MWSHYDAQTEARNRDSEQSDAWKRSLDVVNSIGQKLADISAVRHPRTPIFNLDLSPSTDGLRGPNSEIWADGKVLGNQRAIAIKSPTKARAGRRKRTDNPSNHRKRTRPNDTMPEALLEGATGASSGLEGQGSWDENDMMHGINGEDEENIADDELDAYVDAYQAERVGFIPVGTFLYVVQGWNATKKEGMERWYHFEGRRNGDDVSIACMCPQYVAKKICVHRETYLEFREERYKELEEMVFRDGRVVWFWREKDYNAVDDEESWLNRFSVALGRRDAITLNSRAVVSYTGPDTGLGTWGCSKCSARSCSHQVAAASFMAKVYGRDFVEEDGLPDDEEIMLVDGQNTNDHHENAISFLPIRPPSWAELDSDVKHYERPSPVATIPSYIKLLGTARSMCGQEYGSDTLPDERVRKQCKLYTLTEVLTREIELVHCPTCHHRKHCFIGPETRNIGVFNFNNSVLFTHELLDEYTSRYTSSETPFVAFVDTVGRVYSGRGSHFVKEDLFRSTWFAYVTLQDFGHDMTCPHCKEEPDCLIFDGVTLAFGRKHLLDSLRPPTFTTEASLERYRTYPTWKPQMIPEETKKPIRRLMRQWLDGKGKGRKTSDDEEEEGEVDEDVLETLMGRLERVSPAVAALFQRTFGANAKVDPRLKRLYGVLLEQIAAEEYAVQMVNVSTLPALEDFVNSQDWRTASKLINIPGLYNVLEAERKNNGTYPADLIDVCRWLFERTQEVYRRLSRYDRAEVPLTSNPGTDDWKTTGCFYSLPQIRDRPRYPQLKGDGDPEKSIKEAGKSTGCRKLYASYGQQRLTGGIMCAWCTHSICYGFHCIPKAEGRNDVFAAILTRWKKAPRRVVYDFACALASYCMLREPEFFKDTQFLIDKFHTGGHWKCGSCCFLSSHAVVAELAKVNSSAAECGNSGITRIRKSVSYMRQNRAILYTKVFLSIWNRRQMKKLQVE